MTVDDYLGKVTRPVQPGRRRRPPETAAAFRDAASIRAMALARARIAANPRDADAHYQLGAAVGLARVPNTATVDGQRHGRVFAPRAKRMRRTSASWSSKRTARTRRLIVGTYRYVRVLAGASAAMGGLCPPDSAATAAKGTASDRGKRQAYPGDKPGPTPASPLILLYNREGRWGRCAEAAADPGATAIRANRLVWLEMGSTNLRAGRPAEANRILERCDDAVRQRRFAHAPCFGEGPRCGTTSAGRRARGDRAGPGRTPGPEPRRWPPRDAGGLYGRSHLELGKLALKAGDPRRPRNRNFSPAITLCESDNDAGMGGAGPPAAAGGWLMVDKEGRSARGSRSSSRSLVVLVMMAVVLVGGANLLRPAAQSMRSS